MAKGAFTHHGPVIIDPTPYFGVEPTDQIGSRHAQHGFDCLPDAAQEGFYILLGRLDEQFPVRVVREVAAGKWSVERNDRFEDYTTTTHEV